MAYSTAAFAAYTTVFLENLLVTNPGVATFALSINGAAIASGNAAAAYQDVQRYQILNEIANRVAADKQSGTTFKNVIYDYASSIGSVALSVITGGVESPTAPSTNPFGGPNPVQARTQVA